MKRILITGADSYIGVSFEKWCSKHQDKYAISTIDMRGDSWRKASFSGYDTVLHVAGLAHVSTDPKMKDLYYKVNRDLAIETAFKAKEDAVKQFVFMSSIIVYGDSGRVGEKRTITRSTVPCPTNFYGDSKLQAEQGILALQDDRFNVVILRPPMIYGKGSRGNYPRLAMLAQRLPIFPDIYNERSMLHIDNLCEFIRLMVENEENGLFFPQNREYVNTAEMVKLIAEVHGKKIWLTKLFNPFVMIFGKRLDVVNKAFGNLVYEKSMSEYMSDYRVRTFRETISVTETA